jgi:hypothetical protein
MLNVVVGTIWQTCLVLLPMYIVLLRWRGAAVAAGLVAVTSYLLKKNWYDLLDKETATVSGGPRPASERLEPASG